MAAKATLEPVILLLGAKSTAQPLEAIPKELSQLKQLFTDHPTDGQPFSLEYEPYFTKSQLAKKLNHLQNRVAILHFAGHSSGEGVLTDDELVYSRHIADHIGTWRIPPALIVLNGCHNAAQVKLFHQAGVSVVIATHRAIDDKLAAGFAQAFYSALLTNPKTATLQTAFAQASSNTLMGKNRQARSLDIGDDSPAAWDWDIFPQQGKQREWTFHDLLTTARPVLDADGKLYNPYKGLEAFREEDQSWFFGREALTDELLATLAPQGNPPPRFFSLLGASGSGKSSVINAGVVPKLRDRQPAALILQTRPGAEPFKELATLITRQLYPDSISQQTAEARALAEQLAQPDAILPDLIKRLLETGKHANPQLYLFIDQFEELFTHSKHQQVQRYLQQLVALIESDVPCTLVIIMRADFLASALAHPQFAGHLDTQPHKMLSPMSEAELRTAIERPAQRQQVELEPGLTSTLLRDVENQPGSLPLLQYVLSLLWEKQEQQQDQLIQLEEYTAFGGLSKALEERANSLYRSFTPEQQQLCQRIFLRLVQPGEGTDDTRRRAGLHEFSSEAEQAVIQQLANARLITTQGSEAAPNGNGVNTGKDSGNNHSAYAEVSHEALIRTWSQLKEWIEANRDELRTQHQISAGTKDWLEHDKAKDWLLTGTRLSVAEEWLKKNPKQPSEGEKAFIKVSSKQQKQKRLFTYVLTAFAFAALIIIAIVINNQRQKAIAAKAETDKKILEANYNLAKAYEQKIHASIIEGNKNKDVTEYRKAWLYALEATKLKIPSGHNALNQSSLNLLSDFYIDSLIPEKTSLSSNPKINYTIQSISYSPDGNTLASGSMDSKIRLWNTKSGQLKSTLTGHTGKVWVVKYSPDGNILASGSSDKTIRIWNIKDNKAIHILEGHDGYIRALSFSPNGEVLASGSRDHTIKLWNTKNGKLIKTINGHNRDVDALAFAPNGNVLASGSRDKTIKIWDINTKNLKKTLIGHHDYVTSLDFKPNSHILASASRDNTIKIWNIKDAKPKATIKDNNKINNLKYSPNGDILAFTSSDKIIKLWDTETEKINKTLVGHTDYIWSLDFSLDGKTLVSTSEVHETSTEAIKFWNIKTGRIIKQNNNLNIRLSTHQSNIEKQKIIKSREINQSFRGHEGSINALAYSPDKKTFASASSDKTIKVWDTETRKVIKTFKGHTAGVYSITFAPNGEALISGSDDNTIKIWNAKTGEIKKTLKGHKGRITSLLFIPNENMLASASLDKTIKLWDIKTGNLKDTLKGHTKGIRSIALVNDENIIASGSEDETIKLWDVKTGLLKNTLTGHEDYVNSLAFNHHDEKLASGSDDRSIKIWDIKTGKLEKTLNGHNDFINTIDYSQDGKKLSSASSDKTIKIWDSKTGKLERTLNGHDDRIWTLTYSPDGDTLISGADDKKIKFWDKRNFATQDILYKYSSIEVSHALKFLWELDIDKNEGVLTQQLRTPALLPNKYGYYYSEDMDRFLSLLDEPRQGETKADQLIRWLEEQCVYKNTEEKNKCCINKEKMNYCEEHERSE